MTNLYKNKTFAFCIAACIAIAIQVQITIFQSGNYAGLRINLVDLFLPVLGIFILLGIVTKKTKLPALQIKRPIIWLSALFAVLLLALLNSYFLYQEISIWALFNKTIGFLILSAYFMLSGWLGNQSNEKQLLYFLQIFVGFFCTTLLAQLIDYILYFTSITDHFYTQKYPMAGFSGNKNTYVFLYSICLGIATLFSFKEKYSKLFVFILWAAIPLFYIFTGARTMLLLLPFLLPLLFFLASRINKKIIFIAMLFGTLSAMMFVNFKTLKVGSFSHHNYEVFKNAPSLLSEENPSNLIEYRGDSIRLDVLQATLQLIKENPILGSGLGSIIRQDISEKFPNMIMDSTPLWLWAETGIIGLAFFLSFYFVCLRQFWINGFKNKSDPTTVQLNQFAFCMMLIFSVMCLFHELLYTRFLWFFMGLALAYNVKPSLHVKKKFDGDQATLARV